MRALPPVTTVLVALCVLATGAVLVEPSWRNVLGGIEPRTYPWQPFTCAFVHGWPGFPAFLHLGLNLLLLVPLGRAAEELLGSRLFAGLVIVAIAANGAVVVRTDGVNGSSLFIWAFGPPLLVGLRRAPERVRDPDLVRGLLWVLFVIVPLAMTATPYANGWQGDPAEAFLRANLFHLTAVVVGFAVAGTWWRRTVPDSDP